MPAIRQHPAQRSWWSRMAYQPPVGAIRGGHQEVEWRRRPSTPGQPFFIMASGREPQLRHHAPSRRKCQAMKTQYYTAASLDGFIATLDDSLEWLFPLADINATSYPEFITQVGALAMGSATYAWIVRHVGKPDSPTPGAWPYQPPAWVFSRRALPRIAGADSRFVPGDVRPSHAQMRAAAH